MKFEASLRLPPWGVKNHFHHPDKGVIFLLRVFKLNQLQDYTVSQTKISPSEAQLVNM